MPISCSKKFARIVVFQTKMLKKKMYLIEGPEQERSVITPTGRQDVRLICSTAAVSR